MVRNPAWTRDELILALDLYFREPSARGDKKHPACEELSQLLNQLPIHPGIAPGTNFRNANGVAMKLGNFLRCDPDYPGAGLKAGNKLEQPIWDEFSGDLLRLRKTAEAIRLNAGDLAAAPATPAADISDDEEAEEGRVLTRVHQARERNRSLVAKKKKKVLQDTGRLACEACGFDFSERYGQLGKGFAECHHEKPVSDLKPGEKTKLSDLRIVCANCHRMIHRSRPWMAVTELRQRLNSARST